MTNYDLIIKVIKEAIDWSDYQCDYYEEEKYLTMIQATTLIDFFVEAFEKVDSTFDKDQFLRAVGYDELEPPFETENK
jgi:hypothetical protein